MKKTVFLLLVLCIAFAKNSSAQITATPAEVAGDYTTKRSLNGASYQSSDGTEMWWKLTMSLDGRFDYHFFRQHPNQEEEHFRGRGNWEVAQRTISFSTNEGDVNEAYFLDFSGSKARFFKPSPRNKKAQNQPRYLHFFTSEAEAIKNLRLYKIDA